MTSIHQNSIANKHSIDDQTRQNNANNERREGQTEEGRSSNGISSATVNISFNAELRLKAYQEQRKIVEPMPNELAAVHSEKISLSLETTADKQIEQMIQTDSEGYEFSQNINHMLSEVQNNIVKKSDPGYQYLVNMLNNHMNTVEDPQQLQEIMRKEQFYLTRRKPFMQNSDFQSYSQVLNQFTNIVERQQYAHQSNF